PGYLSELPLERCGHGRGHGVRTGARKLRRYQDGREIDLWQRRHRQHRKCHDPDERQRSHQQGGCDRTANEERRDVHDGLPGAFAATSVLASTRDPACRRYWPLTTTRSSGARPLVTMATSSLTGLASIGRCSAVLSVLMTQA